MHTFEVYSYISNVIDNPSVDQTDSLYAIEYNKIIGFLAYWNLNDFCRVTLVNEVTKYGKAMF